MCPPCFLDGWGETEAIASTTGMAIWGARRHGGLMYPFFLFQLKSDLQKRLQADPSFTPQRFPNAQQAFVAEDS